MWGHSASAKAVLVIPLSSDPPSLDEGDEGEEEEPFTVESSPPEPVVDRRTVGETEKSDDPFDQFEELEVTVKTEVSAQPLKISGTVQQNNFLLCALGTEAERAFNDAIKETRMIFSTRYSSHEFAFQSVHILVSPLNRNAAVFSVYSSYTPQPDIAEYNSRCWALVD